MPTRSATSTACRRCGANCAPRAAAVGTFLCGDFGIVDAMFAPVAVRFRGYGVDMDADARAFVDAIHALPAFARWQAEALAGDRAGAVDRRLIA